MSRKKSIQWLGSTFAIAAVVAVVGFAALSLGSRQPTRVSIPNVVAPQAPAGCAAVAPGAYTAICPEQRPVAEPPAAPVAGPNTASDGCRPVAPGAYSQICPEGGAPQPAEPGTTLECRPVAPGAITEICTRR